MRRTVAFIAALLFTTSISAQSKFEQLGLSFTVPAGWEIADLEKGDASVYFSCEKKGGQDEVAAFSIIGMDLDLEDHMKNTIDEYQRTLADMGAKVKWAEMTAGTIGSGLEAQKVSFVAEDGSGKHDGTIYVFRACNNTVLLILSGPQKDAAANSAAFELMTGSLSCQ
jgi:hypothetical protein